MRQLFQHHPVVGHAFIPRLQCRVPHDNGSYLVRTNLSGFRSNREYVTTRPAHTKRILLFGDSFTAGDGVSNDKRFGDLLESTMPGLEVYNFGLPGSGTDQQYLIYREHARSLEHDLLIVAVLIENIRRVRSRYRPYLDESGAIVYYVKPHFELSGGELVLRNVPVDKAPIDPQQIGADRVQELAIPGLNSDAGAALLDEYDDPSGPGWSVLRAILTAWIREHSVPVMVMPLPTYPFVEDEQCDATRYLVRFEELRAATGCLLHDPLPDLRRYSPAERRAFRFARDVHPTAAGHAAIAASLRPAVARALDTVGCAR